jgi:hypothetical protein
MGLVCEAETPQPIRLDHASSDINGHALREEGNVRAAALFRGFDCSGSVIDSAPDSFVASHGSSI